MDLWDPGTVHNVDIGNEIFYLMLDLGTLSRFCQLSLGICNLRSCTTVKKLFPRLKETDPVYILIRFDEPLRT
jgi:hypothetical protein